MSVQPPSNPFRHVDYWSALVLVHDVLLLALDGYLNYSVGHTPLSASADTSSDYNIPGLYDTLPHDWHHCKDAFKSTLTDVRRVHRELWPYGLDRQPPEDQHKLQGLVDRVETP